MPGLPDVPVEDINGRSTSHLMQLSGMMRPLRKAGSTTGPLPSLADIEEEGYWPLGIQQTGPLPIFNLYYGRVPLGQTLPPSVPVVTQQLTGAVPTWRSLLASPVFKIVVSLLIGLALLVAAAFFVNLPQAWGQLVAHLGMWSGLGLAWLAGLTFLAIWTVRGLRWKLFLNPVGPTKLLQVIELYQVATFLNFFLPVRSGEAAKSLSLKRVAGIPISKSLPTVAMDKGLDVFAALFLLAFTPLLAPAMNLALWIVAGADWVILAALLLLSGLIAFKRPLALALLRGGMFFLPRSLGNKIEGLITGFIDALLAGVSRPMIFLPALLLTGVAVFLEGLFFLLAFSTIGFAPTLGTVFLGYALCSIGNILPAPPGQLGSFELVGWLVFVLLIRVPLLPVAAMYIFAHLCIALFTSIAGLGCLAGLGLSLSTATRAPNDAD
jgi:uncharacterized protein (TIRG00374 family)